MEQKVRNILEQIIHPETGKSIVNSSMVKNIGHGEEGLEVTLEFRKSRDPFARSVTRQVEQLLEKEFPGTRVRVTVAEPAPVTQQKQTTTGSIGKVIAVASGKGGVGKSTVTANTAALLTTMGYRVGILDADIYGPSQPRMYGTEGYMPAAVKIGETDTIMPALSHGVKIMSIGYFINPEDALVWRGPMATGALKQLIHQTNWGELDYLLVDLPPGTGDVHLTVLGELKVDGAIIVSTPQQVAVADVRRGVNMFRSEGMQIPVLGIVENMAWFSPAELPENKYYVFGRGGARELSKEENLDFLGEIPLIISVMENAESGTPAVIGNEKLASYYSGIVQAIVEKPV